MLRMKIPPSLLLFSVAYLLWTPIMSRKPLPRSVEVISVVGDANSQKPPLLRQIPRNRFNTVDTQQPQKRLNSTIPLRTPTHQ